MKAHAHSHDGPGPHTHGAVDPALLTAERGIWAVKWSLLVLAITAALQLVVVVFTGSVALLADTMHNLGDAGTAIPLWIAFRLAGRAPTRRFTYGLGRFEDLAGIAVVLTILVSAMLAGTHAIDRLLNPQPVEHLWAVAVAAIVGFVGNEMVARFRIRVGEEIASAALVADGQHARADALTSLAVLASVIGVWLGFPLADPLVGLAITIAILRIVWESGKTVLTRAADGVDPEVVSEIERELGDLPGIEQVTGVRVRWLGHRMLAEVSVAIDGKLTVTAGHEIAVEARHRLLHRLPYLSDSVVHVDPEECAGDEHHKVDAHAHDGLGPHGHC
ncbi:MAG TPA: cation diffusion facilitator family transporter [Coriobacteriia bacterium]|nr:cation diffusion facilitator family transporter [Coriobacteriia bacterium]